MTVPRTRYGSADMLLTSATDGTMLNFIKVMVSYLKCYTSTYYHSSTTFCSCYWKTRLTNLDSLLVIKANNLSHTNILQQAFVGNRKWGLHNWNQNYCSSTFSSVPLTSHSNGQCSDAAIEHPLKPSWACLHDTFAVPHL